MIEKAVNSFEKGLVIVEDSLTQPTGSYPFALNTIQENPVITPGLVSNEKGFERYVNLSVDDVILGYCALENAESVLFIYNAAAGTKSKIVLVKDANTDELVGSTTTLFSSNDLNFSLLHPIKTEYKIDNNGDRIVYFVDGLNQVRSINIDDVSNYTVNSSNFFPEYSVPLMTTAIQDNGGSLLTGSYRVFIAYKQTDVLTAYTALSQSINIAKNPESDTTLPDELKGGNASNLPTTKSIEVSLTELDSRFDELVVGYIRTMESTRDVYILTSVKKYSTTSINLVIRGDENVDTTLLPEDILIDQPIIEHANLIAQKNSRLVLGNIKYKNNVLDYQSYANNIQVTYYTDSRDGISETMSVRSTEVTLRYATEHTTTARQYKTSFDVELPMTLLRDEVYALGIQFELKDGSYTPVYHIPGRAINTKADGSVYSVADVANTPYGDYYTTNYANWDSGTRIDGVTPGWKSFNTGLDNGELGYYESEEYYPEGYGFPTTGSSSTGEGTTNIRHHRLPDNRISPLGTTTSTGSMATTEFTTTREYLGLTFNNIEIPAEILEQVSGFRIMFSPRDVEQNKSILGKGIFQNVTKCTFNSATWGHTPRKFNDYDMTDYAHDLMPDNSGAPAKEAKLKGFISPETSFNSPKLNAVQAYGELMYTMRPYYCYADASNNTIVEYAAYGMASEISALSDLEGTLRTPIIEALYIPHNSNVTNLGNISLIQGFYNEGRQPIVLLELDDDFKNDADYDDINDVANTDVDNISNFIYGSIKKENTSQYGDILNLRYIPTDVYIKDLSVDGSDLITATVQGIFGDTYIDLFSTRRTHAMYKDALTNPPEQYTNSIIFLCESSYNLRLRNIGEEMTDSAFPQGALRAFGDAIYEWFYELISIKELFSVNADYYNSLADKIYEGFATKTVDIGNDTSHITRLLYSDLDNLENTTDPYRIFRANNYRDLQKNTGALTALFSRGDLLYAATQNSLWLLQSSQQQLQTDVATIVLGTGEFLSIEPRQVLNTKSGYLGTENHLGIALSQYGTLIIDSKRGAIYLYNEQAQEITLNGIGEWFFNNSSITLAKYGVTNLNPHNPNGVGFHAAFDVELDRYLITKRDYDLVDPDLFKGPVSNIPTLIEAENLAIGDIVLDTDTQVFQVMTAITPSPTYTALDLNDATYFSSKGFTLSYNLLSSTWRSFHTYIPSNYLEVQNRLYSRNITNTTILTQALYRHHKGIYGRYYGPTTYPMILETTLTGNNPYTKVFDSFTVESYASGPDATYNSKVIEDLCFDEVVIYNDKQCSGVITLDTNNLKRSERVWHFNNFKDLSVNVTEPIWITDYTFLQDDYFIDKILNGDRLDINKPWYEKARFRDKYINARFTLNNLDNKKFLCNFVTSNYRPSYR